MDDRPVTPCIGALERCPLLLDWYFDAGGSKFAHPGVRASILVCGLSREAPHHPCPVSPMALPPKMVLFILAAMVATALPLGAQVPEAWFEQGKAAFESGRYDQALAALDHIPRKHVLYPEAQYYLARIYLTPDRRDVGKAKKAIKEALKASDETVRYLEVDLWIKQFHRSSLLPSYQFIRRKKLAEKILDLDPENAVAHFVLGVMHYENFDARHDAVAFAQISRMRALPSEEDRGINGASSILDADLVRTDSGGVVTFVDHEFSGREIPATGSRKQALEDYTAAVAHLRRAIATDPSWEAAYTCLMRLYIRRGALTAARDVLRGMQKYLPDRERTWLYLGYVAHRMGNEPEAREAFDRALERMRPQDRVAFEDVGVFLSEDARRSYESDTLGGISAFWNWRDPRYLTPENERLLEHYSRLVYADLRFGEMEEDLRGWRPEPGQVIERYGEPPGEARFNSATDRYALFHYGDLQFRFMDLVKAGRYYFYSPSATAFQGPTSKTRERENDYAITGPETFRKYPERYAYEPPDVRVRLPFLTSQFKGEAGRTDLVVSYGIPLADASDPDAVLVNLRTGVFLLTEGSAPVTASHITLSNEPESPPRDFASASLWTGVHEVRVAPGPYAMSVEFEAGLRKKRVGFERSTVNVRDFRATGFSLSDVLLAYHVEETVDTSAVEGGFRRDGLLIEPAPWGVFGLEAPVYLYFEMYNLSFDTDASTRFAVEAVLVEGEDDEDLEKLIRRAFQRREGVSVRFEGSGSKGEQGQYLMLDVHRESPGTYVLAVRVTDRVSGKTLEAHRSLVLE